MTLVEVMVVIAILVLIGGAVAVTAIDQANKARVSRAKTDLIALRDAMDLHKAQHGRYPDPSSGLAPLKKPLSLRTIRDPWGNDYLYELRNGAPILRTLGADGVAGGDGDDADLSSEEPD